jgi:glutathione S-transferase
MEARFMYTLYIANKNYSSWSLRPWVLMKELGIAFDEQLRRFEPGGAWSSFRTFSPTGKVPTLRDGENTVWDSLAIAEYLAERHAGVWPADAKARAWARCASAEMHSAFATLRQQCSFNLGLRVKLREMPEALKKDVARIDELWSEGPRPLWWPLSRRGIVHGGGCFLCSPGVQGADLWATAWIQVGGLCEATAGAAVDGCLVRGGAEGGLPGSRP